VGRSSNGLTTTTAWACAGMIIALNVLLLGQQLFAG
jgi:hypothetical protein